MNDRSSTAKVVGGTAGWGGDEHTVALHNGQERVVDVDIEAAHELGVASRDRDFVQSVADGWLDRFTPLAVNKHALFHGRVGLADVLDNTREPCAVGYFDQLLLLIVCVVWCGGFSSEDGRVQNVLHLSDLEVAEIAKRAHAHSDDFGQ